MSAIFDGSGSHSEDNSTNYCTTIFICHEYFNNDIELLIFQSCYVVDYLRCFHFSWNFHFSASKAFVACWLFFQLSILLLDLFDLIVHFMLYSISPFIFVLCWITSLVYVELCIQIFNCGEYERMKYWFFLIYLKVRNIFMTCNGDELFDFDFDSSTFSTFICRQSHRHQTN